MALATSSCRQQTYFKSFQNMDSSRCTQLRCDNDHNESPWSQFIADTEGRFSPMLMSLPRNFSPLTPIEASESNFCSSKFSPTSCFPPPAKKRAVRCGYYRRDSDHYHLAIDIDPIGIEAARVSSESGVATYGSPLDHSCGYNFSPYNDQTTDDDDQNTSVHDVSPVYSRIIPQKASIKDEVRKRSDLSRSSSTPSSIDSEADVTDDPKTNKKQFEDSVTNLLTTWILDNQMDPYPSQLEKERLAGLSGLSLQQVTDWLTNTRKRHLFPVISGRKVAKSALEKMFLHQAVLIAKTQ